jgi:hypothetical protein
MCEYFYFAWSDQMRFFECASASIAVTAWQLAALKKYQSKQAYPYPRFLRLC